MTQKMLTGPARLLLIAFVVTPALTVGINAATPRITNRPLPGNHSTATVRVRARPDIYLNEGIERWGINE